MIRFNLWGKGNEIGVSPNGELLTRAFNYSTPSFQNLNVINTAFNLVIPQAGQQLVVTGAILSGNRDIGVNGSIMSIYTADAIASITIIDTIIEAEILKSTVFPFLVPNVITNEGLFINAKCDDNSVRVALYGYFIPKVY